MQIDRPWTSKLLSGSSALSRMWSLSAVPDARGDPAKVGGIHATLYGTVKMDSSQQLPTVSYDARVRCARR